MCFRVFDYNIWLHWVINGKSISNCLLPIETDKEAKTHQVKLGLDGKNKVVDDQIVVITQQIYLRKWAEINGRKKKQQQH